MGEEARRRVGSERASAVTIPSWVERSGRVAWAFIGIAVSLVIVVAALASLQELVVPLVIAVVSAVVFAPAVDWLERHRIPRGVGAALTTALVVGIVVTAVAAVVIGVVDRADELEDSLGQAWDEVATRIDGSGLGWLDAHLDLATVGSSILKGAGTQVGALLGSAVGLVGGIILGLVILYYLLKDGRVLLVRSISRYRADQAGQAERIVEGAVHTLRAHARGRSVLAAVQGTFTFVAMAALGVPLPATIAIVNFVGAFVPYLGAFVGGAFAVVMALSTGGVSLALWALAAIVFMNVVLENFLEPRLIGDSINLHPVTVLMATVAGGLVAGLVGLVLAAPAVAIGSDVVRELRRAGFFGRSGPGPTVG